MIRDGEIVRNRKTYPAPREAWIWAVTRCLEARDAGKLTPPLTSHGYLLENITFWSPEKTAGTAVLPSPTGEGVSTKLRSGLGDLMEWSNGGQQ